MPGVGPRLERALRLCLSGLHGALVDVPLDDALRAPDELGLRPGDTSFGLGQSCSIFGLDLDVLLSHLRSEAGVRNALLTDVVGMRVRSSTGGGVDGRPG